MKNRVVSVESAEYSIHFVLCRGVKYCAQRVLLSVRSRISKTKRLHFNKFPYMFSDQKIWS